MEVKEMMREVADRIEQTANVRAVFGEPFGEGADKVIPVARVSVRGGGGGGGGGMPEGSRKGKGSGMGVGMNVATAPVGFIKSSDRGTEFVPIVDRNRAILATAIVAVVAIFAVRGGLRGFGGK